MTISKSHYWGIGIIFAPKSEDYSAGLVINILCWEVNFRWGQSQLKEDQVKEFNNKVKELYKKEK
jgi:hypothetical protein